LEQVFRTLADMTLLRASPIVADMARIAVLATSDSARIMTGTVLNASAGAVMGHNDARGVAAVDCINAIDDPSAEFLHADMGNADEVCALSNAVLANHGPIHVPIQRTVGMPTREGVDGGFAQNSCDVSPHQAPRAASARQSARPTDRNYQAMSS
jgi:hypothetical protein